LHTALSRLYEETRAEGSSHYGNGVVVENGGDIFGRKLVRGVADEETCLADGTVADYDAPAERIVLVSETWQLSGEISWASLRT
jgi:hypothetical protein